MLNSLNNFFFGSGTTGDAAVDETQASQQGELETKDGDMGWVLVDVAGNDGPSQPEEKSKRSSQHPNVCCCVRDSANLPSSAAPPCSCSPNWEEAPGESSSDCENQQDDVGDLVLYERSSYGPRLASQLGESWIVAPPPCFTGTGNVAELAASPLENLLIEHPSMSVYRRTEHTRLLRRESGEEDEMEDEESENREAAPQRARDLVEQRMAEYQQEQHAARRAPHPARPIQACAALAEQMKVTRRQQRQQQAAVGKQLGRKCLNRSNMARMVQSSCRKQASARNRILRPSGCINSRRSQRSL